MECKTHRSSRARKKNPSGRPGQVDFSFGQVTIYQGTRQAVCRLNVLITILRRKGELWAQGYSSVLMKLDKDHNLSVVLLIARRTLTAQIRSGCIARDQNLPKSNFIPE